MAAKNVTVIPASINQRTHKSTETQTRRKVAGYARVSTDSDEQFTSYEAQVDYYTQFIKKNHDWEFVKVYTDEGISGTNIKRREGFNQMVAGFLPLVKGKANDSLREVSHLRRRKGFEPHGLRVSWCVAPKHWLRQSRSPFAYLLKTYATTFNGESRLIDNGSHETQFFS